MPQFNPWVNTSVGYAPASNQNTFAWIQGGDTVAKGYPVGAGAAVVLLDSEMPVMYMKSADYTGRPSAMVKRYLVTEEEYMRIQNQEKISPNTDYVTKEDLKAFMEEAERKFVIRKEKK